MVTFKTLTALEGQTTHPFQPAAIQLAKEWVTAGHFDKDSKQSVSASGFFNCGPLVLLVLEGHLKEEEQIPMILTKYNEVPPPHLLHNPH